MSASNWKCYSWTVLYGKREAVARLSDVGLDEHGELAPIQNEVTVCVITRASKDGSSHLVSSRKYVYVYNMGSLMRAE